VEEAQDHSIPQTEQQSSEHPTEEKEPELQVELLRAELKHNQHRLDCDAVKLEEYSMKLDNLKATIDALNIQGESLAAEHNATCQAFQERIDALAAKIASVHQDTVSLRSALSTDTAADAEQLVLVAANLRANQIENFVICTQDADLLSLTEEETDYLRLGGALTGVKKSPSAPVPNVTQSPFDRPSSEFFSPPPPREMRAQLYTTISICNDPGMQEMLFGFHDGKRLPLASVLQPHMYRLETRLLDALASEYAREDQQSIDEALSFLNESSRGIQSQPLLPHRLNL
jgi:hypothetical protein